MNQEKKFTILMYPYNVYGGLNPFIGIAQNLQIRGHKMIFAIENSFNNDVTNCGFETIVIPSQMSSQFNNERDAQEFYANYLLNNGIFSSSLSPLENMRRRASLFVGASKHRTMNNDAIIKEIIDRIKPNIVIIDAYLCAAPSLIKSGIPWISCGISNPLMFIDDIRTPPIYSGLPADDSNEWSNFREEHYKVIKPIENEINKWLIEKRVSPLPPNRVVYPSKCLNIYNFPLELDYTDLRPLPSKWTQFDAFVRMENQDFVIPKKLSDKTGKLIYITMGTLTSANVEMMKRLIEILKVSEHRYIMSKGIFGDRYELPDNMWGEPMLPQTKVLPLVNMVITHGGNNSIVESFYFGKPMIVMPLCGDQFNNAQRVHEKGFGIRMDPNLCTKEELINGIERILNYSELTIRMKQISKRIQNEAKSDKLALLIEDIVYNCNNSE